MATTVVNKYSSVCRASPPPAAAARQDFASKIKYACVRRRGRTIVWRAAPSVFSAIRVGRTALSAIHRFVSPSPLHQHEDAAARIYRAVDARTQTHTHTYTANTPSCGNGISEYGLGFCTLRLSAHRYRSPPFILSPLVPFPILLCFVSPLRCFVSLLSAFIFFFARTRLPHCARYLHRFVYSRNERRPTKHFKRTCVCTWVHVFYVIYSVDGVVVVVLLFSLSVVWCVCACSRRISFVDEKRTKPMSFSFFHPASAVPWLRILCVRAFYLTVWACVCVRNIGYGSTEKVFIRFSVFVRGAPRSVYVRLRLAKYIYFIFLYYFFFLSFRI